jgi:hypothetical protein
MKSGLLAEAEGSIIHDRRLLSLRAVSSALRLRNWSYSIGFFSEANGKCGLEYCGWAEEGRRLGAGGWEEG